MVALNAYCDNCGVNSLDAEIRVGGVMDRDGVYYGALCNLCWDAIALGCGSEILDAIVKTTGSDLSPEHLNLARMV